LDDKVGKAYTFANAFSRCETRSPKANIIAELQKKYSVVHGDMFASVKYHLVSISFAQVLTQITAKLVYFISTRPQV